LKLQIDGADVRVPFEVEKVNLIDDGVTVTATLHPNDRRVDLALTASAGAGVTDGDKGDITVSGSGATWTVDSNAVTYAKMQDATAGRVLGRRSGSNGDPEELTPVSPVSVSAGGNLTCSASVVTVNGGSTTAAADFDDATPAAAAGRVNVAWASSGVGPTDVSASVPSGPTLFKALSTGAAGTALSTAAQPWFPTAGAVTLTANRAYRFRGLIVVTRDNAGALSTGFGGTATISSILAYSIGQSAAADTNGTAQTSSWRQSTALVTAAPSANVSWAYIEGILRVTTGGTLIPQFATSISALLSITVESGTFFELTEIGADTVTERGTWS
jgi:hypothetical protein